MKKLNQLKVIGFAASVVAAILTIAGIANFDSLYYVEFFGNEEKRIPLGVQIFYIALGVMLIGAVIWAIGYLKDKTKGMSVEPSHAALRVLGFMPAVCGIFSIIGGLLIDNNGYKVYPFGITLKLYTILIGIVVAIVFALIWFIGFSKSESKLCVLLQGDSASAKMLRDYKSELGKVVWLSWKETLKQTGVVVASLVAVGAAVGVVDLGLIKLIELLVKVI